MRIQTYVLAFFRGPGLPLCFGIPFASKAGADLFDPGAGPLRLLTGTVGVGASSLANGSSEGSTSTSGAASVGKGVSTSSLRFGVVAFTGPSEVTDDCRASSRMAIDWSEGNRVRIDEGNRSVSRRTFFDLDDLEEPLVTTAWDDIESAGLSDMQ